MKDICILNKNSSAIAYGVGTFVGQFLKCLADLPVSIHVVLLSSDKKEFLVEHTEKVTYYYIPENIYFSGQHTDIGVYEMNVLYLIFPYIKTIDPVFILNTCYKSEFLTALQNRWPSSKLIHIVHFMNDSILKKEQNTNFEDQETIDFGHFVEKIDKLVCLSRYSASLLTRLYNLPADKVNIIYNGLPDRRVVLTKEENKQLRIKLGFSSNDFLLLFVGRVDMFKGIYPLLKAFHELRAYSARFRLIVVGGGCMEEYLPECDGDWGKVTFTGKISQQYLDDFYQIADLGIIPSFGEQCSYVGIEMLMYGLPVVTSSAPGLDEMFSSEKDIAYKIPPMNNKQDENRFIEDIIIAVKDAFSDSRKRKRIGINGRKHYLSVYEAKRFNQNYSDFLKELNIP